MDIQALITEYENRKEAHENKLSQLLKKETYTQDECDKIYAHKIAINLTNEFLKSLKQLV